MLISLIIIRQILYFLNQMDLLLLIILEGLSFIFFIWASTILHKILFHLFLKLNKKVIFLYDNFATSLSAFLFWITCLLFVDWIETMVAIEFKEKVKLFWVLKALHYLQVFQQSFLADVFRIFHLLLKWFSWSFHELTDLFWTFIIFT